MPAADASLGQLEGVDSSHYQGTINPVVGRDQYGIQWWAHKATEGTSYVDPTFKQAQNDLRNAGIKYRVWYHFPRGNQSIEAQVAHFLQTIGPLEVGEAAKLDDESAQSLGYPLTIAQAALWHRLVEEATGRPTVEYTGAFVTHPTDAFYHWDADDIRNSTIPGAGERPNIFASYNPWSKVVTRGKPVHVWQWTSTAVLPGICTGGIGRIDRDLVRDPHAYDLACGYGAVDVPDTPIPVQPPSEEDDMPAFVVAKPIVDTRSGRPVTAIPAKTPTWLPAGLAADATSAQVHVYVTGAAGAGFLGFYDGAGEPASATINFDPAHGFDQVGALVPVRHATASGEGGFVVWSTHACQLLVDLQGLSV